MTETNLSKPLPSLTVGFSIGDPCPRPGCNAPLWDIYELDTEPGSTYIDCHECRTAWRLSGEDAKAWGRPQIGTV